MTQPREYQVTFGGIGEREIQASGRFVFITDATGPVYVTLDNGSELTRGKKSNIDNGIGFKRVKLRSTIAQTVTFTVSDQKQDDGRDDISVTATASIAPAGVFIGMDDEPLTAGVAKKIVAGGGVYGSRRAVLIKNGSANDDSVRLGNTGFVGAAKGFELEPGESITLATDGDVWAYSPSDQSLSISLLESI